MIYRVLISVFLGTYLAYRFAIKKLWKQKELNQKSKVKWISCQESWILLCEFPENLIGIFTNDSIVEFAYGNNWKHGHFDEIRRVL